MGNTTVREVLVNAGKGKAKRQKGGGAKKIGRSKLKCGKYKASGRREKNKARNIAKDAKVKAKKRLRKLGKTLL
jgi:hypothetical protein